MSGREGGIRPPRVEGRVDGASQGGMTEHHLMNWHYDAPSRALVQAVWGTETCGRSPISAHYKIKIMEEIVFILYT